MRVAQEHLVQIPEGGARRVEQGLATLGMAPNQIRLEQGGDLALEALLLHVEAALPPLDPADEVRDRDAHRTDDAASPRLGRIRLPRRRDHGREARRAASA